MLDRKRDYGMEYGPAGLYAYVQDGRRFNLKGEPIAAEPPSPPAPSAPTDGPSPDVGTPPSVELTPPVASTDAPKAPDGVANEPKPKTPAREELSALPFFSLRSLAIARGCPDKNGNKETFIRFLTGEAA